MRIALDLFSIVVLPILFLRAKLYSLFGIERVVILIFHEVIAEDQKKFCLIISFLNSYFGFITPEEFTDYIENKKRVGGVKFLITFDDGFISSLDATKLILDPLNIKAVFFICPSFVEIPQEKVPDFITENFFFEKDDTKVVSERYPIRKNDLLDLDRKGHAIAAHTLSHQVLSSLERDSLLREIIGSKIWLEDLLGKEVKWFAYPFGGINHIDKKSLKIISQNFKLCFSGIRGQVRIDANPYGLPRTSVDLNSNILSQISLSLGATFFLHSKKHLRLKGLLN